MLAGSHPDVSITRAETAVLYIKDMRQLVHRSALAPVEKRWQVMIVEDADRLGDSEGRTGTSTGVVSVGEGAEPDLNFVWSPQSPTVGQQVIFNAEASQPVAGRTFTSYDWNFGNGKTASGPVVPMSFSQAGTYNVVLVVTDNLGVVFRVTDSITIAP